MVVFKFILLSIIPHLQKMNNMSRRLITNFSRNYSIRSTISPKQSSLCKTVVDEFSNYMPKIVKNELARATFIETSDVTTRLQEIAEYYTAGRRPVQGEFMAFTYEFLKKPNVNKDLTYQIQVLATTIELIQTYFFFWDDLEDGDTLRCGKQCWHLRPGVGLLALNDACLLRSLITEIIEQNFDGEILKNLLHVYNRNFFISAMGQHYDTEITKEKNYEKYTPEAYGRITRGKSSSYSLICPALTALAFANKLTPKSYNNVVNNFNDLGMLVQIHNDMIDFCISEGAEVGKSGTDIQKGKCSWPAVAILQQCNPSERQVFQENYGSWDPEKVERIHELYHKFDVISLYKQELAARREAYFKRIKALPEDSTPSAEFYTEFYNLFNQYTKDLTLMYDKH